MCKTQNKFSIPAVNDMRSFTLRNRPGIRIAPLYNMAAINKNNNSTYYVNSNNLPERGQ